MSHFDAGPGSSDTRTITPPPRPRRKLTRKQLVFAGALCMLLLSGIVGGWTASVFLSRAASNDGPGLTFQQFLTQGRPAAPAKATFVPPQHVPAVPTSSGAATDYAHLPPGAEPATMKPISQVLASAFVAGGAASAGVQAYDLVSSDQRLEVQVQPGSLDLTHAAVQTGTTTSAVTGGLTLQVTQLSGHYAGSINLLGMYRLQVVDSSGKVISGIALHTPVTFTYHYQPWEIEALNLNPDKLYMTWPDLLAAARQAKQSTKDFIIPLHNDATTHTLTAQSNVLGPGPFDMGGGSPQNQSPVKPHLASVLGNSGDLSYSYPLQVVPGAGGFTPRLSLDYSSGNTNERHAVNSPANYVGEGWSLSLGSISADVYPNGSTDARTWYFISGVDNISDRLVPNPTASTTFLTEHISQLRIRQVTLNGLSCFNVWDTSGTYYEFGCTPDSQQAIFVGSTLTPYRYDLDKIVASNEGAGTNYKIVKISYVQDCADTVNGSCEVRDAGISKITYGFSSSGITNIDTVVGTVDFSYLALPYASTTCESGTTPVANNGLRCDDPASTNTEYTTGIDAPKVMSTLTLQSVTSYVGSDSGPKAYSYTFSYRDTPPTLVTEPISQLQEYAAGEHLLTQVTPTVFQNNSPNQLKPLLFLYTSETNTYSDTTAPTSSLLVESTTWSYLTAYVDSNTGVGGWITYQTAYGNTHGTPNDGSGSSFDDRYDPLHCARYSDCTGSYQHPDDRAWSVQVVTSTIALGDDSNALAPATTNYNYRLTKTGSNTSTCTPAGSDADCVGDNWTPKNSTTGAADSGWVGHERGTVSGPFPLAPHRTVHAPVQRTRLSSLLRP